ncbi:uncharacterized protein LOC128033985 [Gossypium raimondii]|uniref:uncharacterized protein LOC128033985 n=1 Tax=Gossypium raimondii TaxID=29730 RepID=UPI00227CE82C|nr:uncharacterized protein LOC128033985 [Gossypium raimondii]
MEATERIVDDLDFTLEQKLKWAISLLRDEACQWWLTVKEGASYIDARRREFLNLTQGDRSVAEYEREHNFLALVENTKITEEVKHTERQNWDKERGKNKRDSEPSISGMRPKKNDRSGGIVRVRAPVASTGITLCGHCGRRHLGECWRTTGACLGCGSTEHCVGECPLRTNQVQVTGSGTAQPSRVVQQPPRGRDQARSDNGMGYGQRAPGRDIGSTHSYIVCSIFKNLEILVESTFSEVTVLSLLGQFVTFTKLYRDVPLEVQGAVFQADLMELPFWEFDMILGMDWLVKNHFSLDCATKRVVLITEGGNIVVIGERRNYLANMNSTLVAEKLVRKGCDAYLAYVSVFAAWDSTIKDFITVRDFLDVFPEELPVYLQIESGVLD